MPIEDVRLDIATGKSRKETSWKNKKTTWEKLTERLSVTHRTAETVQDYSLFKKDRQAEVKDIGGFVGGYLSGGRRKTENVVHRQILTLDADLAEPDFWQQFTSCCQSAACLYSTHKHTPAAPRYRLVLPLSRPVGSDEYQAIGRYLAGLIGIEQFDNSGFEPHRLMYWPSTPRDGEFVFKEQAGPWLDPDTVLATYQDWRDSSAWPMSERFGTLITTGIKKQGDPLTKHGIVGAFCRAYDIHRAIEAFLSDVYAPTDALPGRYTFVGGSTAAGLITYDDKYAFSHHGTDPASGHLCNAFDLVRIHKFGLKDEDSPGASGSAAPSYKAMADFAAGLPEVRKQIMEDGINDARADFGAVIGDVDEMAELLGEAPKSVVREDGKLVPVVKGDWLKEMDINRKGEPECTINNFYLILNNDPFLKGKIAFDKFENQPVLKGDMPWRTIDYETRFLTDQDLSTIEHRIERVYKICATQKFRKAVDTILHENRFHPVKDYLNALQWDGKQRIETLFIDYLGAEDSEYTRTVTRKTLAAAVARVFRPGCKFDYILTLVGEQGRGKSTIFRKLGRDWFSDTFSLHMLKSSKGYEQMNGSWIIEIAELSGLAKAEIEAIKAFVASEADRYRPAYGHMTVHVPRQSIFVATTNTIDFLRDKTGNRRFWPVRISDAAGINMENLTEDEIDQIWAEAVLIYKKGEKLYLNRELEAYAIQVQKDHTETHPWAPLVHEFLMRLLPENWDRYSRTERWEYMRGESLKEEPGVVPRDRVCILEIWYECLGQHIVPGEREANIIKGIMRMHPDYYEEPTRKRFGVYGRQRHGFFRRGTAIKEEIDE